MVETFSIINTEMRLGDAMNLLIQNIKRIQYELRFKKQIKYEDEKINDAYNNWKFLFEYSSVILKKYKINLEYVLYSEYYWCARFTQEYYKKYGVDSGMDQYYFKLIEKIEHTLGNVDISLLEKLENDDISDL